MNMIDPLDRELYLIVCRYRGKVFGAERCLSDMTLDQTVDDIMSGQVEDVIAVIEFNPIEGWSRLITEDIAIAVANRAARTQRLLSRSAAEFVEEFAGADYTRGLVEVER
jgi:hypothetical protein